MYAIVPFWTEFRTLTLEEQIGEKERDFGKIQKGYAIIVIFIYFYIIKPVGGIKKVFFD